MLRLGVNIDHVATVRNARGIAHPDPVIAARIAQEAGADGITAHLREDRRHIRDADIRRLKADIPLPLNLEMAATPEMLAIAREVLPNACCLVPEKREELTTEGGLDVAGMATTLQPVVSSLKEVGIRVSLFIDPDLAQIEAAHALEADIVELHTGRYCEHAEPPSLTLSLQGEGGFPYMSGLSAVALAKVEANLGKPGEGGTDGQKELDTLQAAAQTAHAHGLECHAGHGLSYEAVGPIAAIPEIVELNIGHFLIGQAIYDGLGPAIQHMRARMDAARG